MKQLAVSPSFFAFLKQSAALTYVAAAAAQFFEAL